jgi:hypothetical protein
MGTGYVETRFSKRVAELLHEPDKKAQSGWPFHLIYPVNQRIAATALPYPESARSRESGERVERRQRMAVALVRQHPHWTTVEIAILTSVATPDRGIHDQT